MNEEQLEGSEPVRVSDGDTADQLAFDVFLMRYPTNEYGPDLHDAFMAGVRWGKKPPLIAQPTLIQVEIDELRGLLTVAQMLASYGHSGKRLSGYEEESCKEVFAYWRGVLEQSGEKDAQ